MYILQLEAGLWRQAGCNFNFSLSIFKKLPRLLEEQKVGVLLVNKLLLLFIYFLRPKGPFSVLWFSLISCKTRVRVAKQRSSHDFIKPYLFTEYYVQMTFFKNMYNININLFPPVHRTVFNYRHVEVNDEHTSKFNSSFNLTGTFALLTRKMWAKELDGGYEIIERDFKQGHSEYYMYVFRMGKVIGHDPFGFPSQEICIYYSWNLAYGDKLVVISAYPFSRSYHDFLKSRRLGYC